MSSTVADRELGPEEAARVRAVLDGEVPPVDPREASTVAVVRDGPSGLEVLLMRRVATITFGGAHAFPGGSAEPEDAEGEWSGPESAWWAERFGIPEPRAHTGVRTASREVAEETGIVLDGFRMAALAHWVTPVVERKRFDTLFFVAALPPDQEPQILGGESDEHTWARPGDPLGSRLLLPPTRAALADLARFDTVDAALAADRVIRLVQPEVRLDGATLRVELPG